MITSTNYPSLCQSCVYRYDVIMLSTYCIDGCTCDGCGKVGDLALTVTKAQYQHNLDLLKNQKPKELKDWDEKQD